VRRVKTSILATLAVTASLLVHVNAHAQESSDELPSTRHKDYSSPQNFAVELRGGSYRPDIDSDPSLKAGEAPYASTFGGRRALVALELDWQIIRIPHMGTLGVGVAAGYTAMSAAAKIQGRDIDSPDKTYLEVFPFYGVGVLRVDVFSRELNIPLVPYGKLGVGYALWNSSSDNGIARVNNTVARGSTWGTHFAAGLALHLNVFDEQVARNFDSTIGVNHTYLFIEAMWMQLDGLGKKNTLPVGDRTWVAGLAFEF
jgi:hypothetical protein